MNHLVWLILDSCRYDTFIQANPEHFTKISMPEKRYSYASWTSPSHFTYLMGLIPHSSPQKVFASAVYKKDFSSWKNRLGINEISFTEFLPEINLVHVLKKYGYYCSARVSLPVLNEATPISLYFDDYRLMDNHNSFKKIIEEIEFPKNKNMFYFINIGETHYPYMLDDESLPHISGVHGVYKNLDQNLQQTNSIDQLFFDEEQLQKLKNQQIQAVRYCDNLFQELLTKCPSNTYFIITSDHGELFGENGYFGHGPIFHEKVFEIPFIEGLKQS